MKDNLYVVYHVKHSDQIVYIGYGSQDRPNHATSGVSNNYHLNRLHHTGQVVITEVVFTTTDKQAAKDKEKEHILLFQPIYNSVYLDKSRQEAALDSKEIRDRVYNILNRLDKNKKSTEVVLSIFETLLKLFTVPQLVNTVQIDGIEAEHFNQFRRLFGGRHRPSIWYTQIESSGLLELTKLGPTQHFVRLLPPE